MSALHPLTMLMWFLWGLFMGLGFATAYGLMRAAIFGWHASVATYHRKRGAKAPAKRKGPKWEYMIVDDPRTSFDSFNSYGEDGWELVSANDNRAWFKRAVA